MPTVVLKKTKAKPVLMYDFKTGEIEYQYLYTNTGKATDWGIALKLTFKKGQEPPDEITLRIELGE